MSYHFQEMEKVVVEPEAPRTKVHELLNGDEARLFKDLLTRRVMKAGKLSRLLVEFRNHSLNLAHGPNGFYSELCLGIVDNIRGVRADVRQFLEQGARVFEGRYPDFSLELIGLGLSAAYTPEGRLGHEIVVDERADFGRYSFWE